MSRACYYCNCTDREMRPYGPNASFVCFPCVIGDDQRNKAAQQQFGLQLNAAEVMSIDGTEVGPVPLDHPHYKNNKCH